MPDGSETVSDSRRFCTDDRKTDKAEFTREARWLRLFGARSRIQRLGSSGGRLAGNATTPRKIIQDAIEFETRRKMHVSKMPAPKGNTNRTRHGLRSTRLPDGCRYLEKATYRMRVQLERECVTRFGSLDMRQAGLIQSAGRHEVRASLAARWLRVEGDRLGISDRIALLREIGNATNARDKAIENLGLNAPEQGAPDSSGRPLSPQEAILAKLRELPPDVLAEYRRQFPMSKRPDPPELRALREQERHNEIERQWMADLTADARGGFPVEHGGLADGPQAGALAESVAANGLDGTPGAGALDAGDDAGDEL